MSSGTQTNASIFASSELLETLRERAYVRGDGDPFLITEELALLATDLVAAFEPSHAAVGREPITAPFGTYQGITEQVIMSRTPGSFRSVCRAARANPNGSCLESTVPERELLKP